MFWSGLYYLCWQISNVKAFDFTNFSRVVKMQTPASDISAVSHVTTVQQQNHTPLFKTSILEMSSKMVPKREGDRKHFYHTHCCCCCGIASSLPISPPPPAFLKSIFVFWTRLPPRGFTVILAVMLLARIVAWKKNVQFSFHYHHQMIFECKHIFS